MSITSRINEMSSHIEQAYDELQGLGADLTNVDKNIENISMVLDDIYDSMPQVSGEGTSLTLDDTRIGKIKSTLKGNTSQSGTPTPTSAIPVNVVSGDNEINVCGKNKLSPTLNDINETISGVKREGTNGTYTLSGTATAGAGGNVRYTLTNTYTIQNGDYLHLCNSTINTNSTIMIFNENDTQINNWSFNVINRVIDISSYAGQKIKSVGFYNNSSFSGSLTTSPMIINSNTVTNFEPYQGNTYNIDLPEGMELCKIGNYQDYFYKDSGKWYLHKEIGKVVLDGSESYGVEQSGGYYRFNITKSDLYNYNGRGTYAISNYYHAQETNDYGAIITYQNRIMLYPSDTSITTEALFKAWLSTHNTEVYYVYATPTNTEITYQPLIDQLNLLEKAMSKDGQTNISQVNNDLPFIISASALKEWSE